MVIKTTIRALPVFLMLFYSISCNRYIHQYEQSGYQVEQVSNVSFFDAPDIKKEGKGKILLLYKDNKPLYIGRKNKKLEDFFTIAQISDTMVQLTRVRDRHYTMLDTLLFTRNMVMHKSIIYDHSHTSNNYLAASVLSQNNRAWLLSKDKAWLLSKDDFEKMKLVMGPSLLTNQKMLVNHVATKEVVQHSVRRFENDDEYEKYKMNFFWMDFLH